MFLPQSPNHNQLLAALPAAELEPLQAQLELVHLALGEMLYEPGVQMRYAYFPTTAIVSLHYLTVSGATAETAGVGNEGMVGISLYMGGAALPARRWFRRRDTLTGWSATCCRRRSTGRACYSVCCCATPRP